MILLEDGHIATGILGILDRRLREPERLRREESAMTGDDPSLGIDEDRVANPNSRIEAAICSICRLGWVRALRGSGRRLPTGRYSMTRAGAVVIRADVLLMASVMPQDTALRISRGAPHYCGLDFPASKGAVSGVVEIRGGDLRCGEGT